MVKRHRPLHLYSSHLKWLDRYLESLKNLCENNPQFFKTPSIPLLGRGGGVSCFQGDYLFLPFVLHILFHILRWNSVTLSSCKVSTTAVNLPVPTSVFHVPFHFLSWIPSLSVLSNVSITAVNYWFRSGRVLNSLSQLSSFCLCPNGPFVTV